MEGRNYSNASKLLIDLDTRVPQLPLPMPLIPVPDNRDRLSISPLDNPFDVLSRELVSDPFEQVFKRACLGNGNSKDKCLASEKNEGSSQNVGAEKNSNTIAVPSVLISATENVLTEETISTIRCSERSTELCSEHDTSYLGKNQQFHKIVRSEGDNCDVNVPPNLMKNTLDSVCTSNQESKGNKVPIDFMDPKQVNIPTINIDECMLISNQGTCRNVESENNDFDKSENNDFNVSISPIMKAVPVKTLSSGVIDYESSIQQCTYKNTTLPALQDTAKSSPDNDRQTQVSADFSSEEGLKALIAKRVNKCIQKVLNNTFNSKNKTNENLKNGGVNTKKTQNRRSLSFVLSPRHSKCDKLNRSCEPYNFGNQESRTPDSSIGSGDIKLLDSSSVEASKTEDLVVFPTEKEQVFEEAKKLARTFSKLADSFCGAGFDSEDDWMTCKPPWLDHNSSDDEDDKLRKDPKLNIRVSLSSSSLQTQPDSQALTAFKSRHRRSLGLQVNDSQEETVKRSNSVGCKPVQVSAAPAIVTSVPVAVEEKLIRIKKKNTTDMKRGPMRAVMPVQSMTKESLQYKGKMVRTQEKSPSRKLHSIRLAETPSKDNSQLSIQPVASSTPNKSVSGLPTLLSAAIKPPSNKRHSLGSTVEIRKSRTPTAEDGARVRSNSANSNIPTPAGLVKTNTSSLADQKPRSTSSLIRVSSFKNQVQSQRNSMLEKNSTPKLPKSSFNPRALNEVKTTKISGPGRVKSAVNTLSNLVMGKSKKVAASDKENRVPV